MAMGRKAVVLGAALSFTACREATSPAVTAGARYTVYVYRWIEPYRGDGILAGMSSVRP
jgi:hypothetical protein